MVVIFFASPPKAKKKNMAFNFRKKIAIISFVLILIIQGCSLRGVAYRHADFLIMVQLDDWLDLSRAQKHEIEPLVEAAVEEFKHDRIPKIIQAADRFIERAKLRLERNDIIELRSIMERELGASLALLAEKGSPILAKLDDDQIQNLEEEFESSTKTMEESLKLTETKWKSRAEKRQTTLQERFEWWLGTPSDRQKELLRDYFGNNREHTNDRLQYRQEIQRSVVELLKTKNESKIRDTLASWAKDPTSGRSAMFNRIHKADRERLLAFIAALDPTLSREQREHGIKKLASLINEFRGRD